MIVNGLVQGSGSAGVARRANAPGSAVRQNLVDGMRSTEGTDRWWKNDRRRPHRSAIGAGARRTLTGRSRVTTRQFIIR
jgi:hypothetical protein